MTVIRVEICKCATKEAIMGLTAYVAERHMASLSIVLGLAWPYQRRQR